MTEENTHSDRLRSRDIFSMLSPRPLWRLVRGMARAPFDADFPGAPLAVCWFTNFSCNVKCHFCCKAAEIRAGRDEFPPVGLDDAKRLMEKIRRTVDLLYLSGGEPTIHPKIIEILEAARSFEFRSIGMSSNLVSLDRKPEILDLLDAVSVSIHSPDVEMHAENLGVSTAVAERVFGNLELLRNHPRRGKIKVLVNCVINHKNIHTVLDMVEFTGKLGFLLELVPANEHGRLPEKLAGNREYIDLIDRIIEMRKSGEAPHIAGSTGYYKRIRDFKPFRCFPIGVPNIMPDGRLCSPCDVSEQYAVNVLDFPSLKEAVRAAKPSFGQYPCREGYCFKAGIVERSRLFGALAKGKVPEGEKAE